MTRKQPRKNTDWQLQLTMRVIAQIQNSEGKHEVTLRTNDSEHSLTIPSKPTGFGSKANGAELLFLALATCYCNDIYREAARRNMKVVDVEVSVEGEFGKEGEAARAITYNASVSAEGKESDIIDLMKYTDTVAEIQNTLRSGVQITLSRVEAKSI